MKKVFYAFLILIGAVSVLYSAKGSKPGCLIQEPVPTPMPDIKSYPSARQEHGQLAYWEKNVDGEVIFAYQALYRLNEFNTNMTYEEAQNKIVSVTASLEEASSNLFQTRVDMMAKAGFSYNHDTPESRRFEHLSNLLEAVRYIVDEWAKWLELFKGDHSLYSMFRFTISLIPEVFQGDKFNEMSMDEFEARMKFMLSRGSGVISSVKAFNSKHIKVTKETEFQFRTDIREFNTRIGSICTLEILFLRHIADRFVYNGKQMDESYNAMDEMLVTLFELKEKLNIDFEKQISVLHPRTKE
ncbi:MAG: hypothetical protein WC471_03405 [Candidatus Woesearchaeota archaeon]